MPLRQYLVLLMLLAVCRNALADGLLRVLPDDGHWAQYDLTVADDSGMGRTGNLILKSVGRLIEDGEPCRWIECDFRLEDQDRRDVVIDVVVKFLIPEKHLGRGGNPWDHVVRAWVQHDGKVERYDEHVRNPMNPLLLAVPGALRGVEPLKRSQEIMWKRGTLRSPEGYRGESTLPAEGRLVQSMVHEVWPHEAAPFGTIMLRQQIRMSDGERTLSIVDAEYVFSDSGKDAKSALPGHR